jgi:Holliday junction resolvase
MTNRSKATGTAWESACVSFLQESGWIYAERRALAGASDRGDVAGVGGGAVMIECKAEKAITLGTYLNEVAAQKANARADIGVAWIKRRGKSSAADGYVVMDGRQFVELLAAAGYR